jgi:hypothetical protein
MPIHKHRLQFLAAYRKAALTGGLHLRRAFYTFKDAYNRRWVLQYHGYRTPAQVRADQTAPPMAT